jgi:hypothetical protein
MMQMVTAWLTKKISLIGGGLDNELNQSSK